MLLLLLTIEENPTCEIYRERQIASDHHLRPEPQNCRWKSCLKCSYAGRR